MRKTKIVCTLGPSTETEEILKNLVLAGMDVARFNFSHSDYQTHEVRFKKIAKIREELGKPIATMLDTRGPEIRIGRFVDDKPVELKNGDTYTLTTNQVEGTNKISSISFKDLPRDVKKDTVILINDGAIEMKVVSKTDTDITCVVVNGGTLSNNKGINVPGIKLSMPYISDIDMSDLEFGAKMGFDFIAASFVRTSADVMYLRKFVNSLGWTTPRIIAKIENMDGVDNIDEIIEAADGVMVARGDMGVEIPFELIPAIQKKIIAKAYSAGKQVITATQMLESMINNLRPTRAEITDVANAIYDGTSAIMLSGETAAGLYPVETVKTMALIARTTEQSIDYTQNFGKIRYIDVNPNITNAISHATVTTALDLSAKAIITVTKTGSTARMISKFRPKAPIIGCTTDPIISRQLNMSWGVMPALIDEKNNTDELIEHAIQAAKNKGYVDSGDLVVITAGVPLGISGTTNLLKVQHVGEKI